MSADKGKARDEGCSENFFLSTVAGPASCTDQSYTMDALFATGIKQIFLVSKRI